MRDHALPEDRAERLASECEREAGYIDDALAEQGDRVLILSTEAAKRIANKLVEAATALLNASNQGHLQMTNIDLTAEALQDIKVSLDYWMNEHLFAMKPEYDDSVTGFNEAWDVVSKFFATLTPTPADGWRGIAEATREAAAKIAADRAWQGSSKCVECCQMSDAAYRDASAVIAAAIRAMPLPSPPAKEMTTAVPE